MSNVVMRGLVRTAENGGRRSRTLRLDDESLQVQAKEMTTYLPSGQPKRYLQLRYWASEGCWCHQVIDPERPGLAGVVAIGYGDRETDSWEMAKLAASETASVEL